jgi:hypothetical protein
MHSATWRAIFASWPNEASLVHSPYATQRFSTQMRLPSMPGEGSIRQVREFGLSLDRTRSRTHGPFCLAR